MEGIRSRQVKWHPKTNKIAQIPKEGLEYALVSDDYEQLHQLVWCKDFVQDVIHGYLNSSLTRIYGFEYDPAKAPPVSMKRTRLMVTNWKDKELGEKLNNGVLPLLHEIEEKLGMSKSVLEKCSKVPPRYGRSGVWLFDSSIRWSKAPPMISLFTMLVRIGLVREGDDDLKNHIRKIKEGTVKCYYSVEKMQDKGQVKRAEAGIKKILKHGDRKLFHTDIKKNYPPLTNSGGKYISLYTIHDNCGIAGFSDGFTESNFPHWHRFDKGAK
jgi:hypothetical protein